MHIYICQIQEKNPFLFIYAHLYLINKFMAHLCSLREITLKYVDRLGPRDKQSLRTLR
jgi:hypothetical protein